MNYRILTTNLCIGKLGQFVRGDLVELDPENAKTIRRGLIEPVAEKKPQPKEGK